jgi:hypothetical protein
VLLATGCPLVGVALLEEASTSTDDAAGIDPDVKFSSGFCDWGELALFSKISLLITA